MKKRIVKTTLAMTIVVASAVIGYASYTQYQNKQLAYANPLMEENLEALAEGNNGNTCYVSTYECSFTVESSAQIPIIKNKLGIKALSVGITVDLSGLTKKYCIYHWYNIFQDEVPCGTDYDCQKLLASIK